MSWPGQPLYLCSWNWHDPTLEYDVLDKVDLLGCTKGDLKDWQEVRKVLREYANVFV